MIVQIKDAIKDKLLTVTAFISLSWPGKVCLHDPSRISQSLALASHAPETKVRISGANDRDITSPVWPRNEVHCWPVSISHRALQRNIRKSESLLYPSKTHWILLCWFFTTIEKEHWNLKIYFRSSGTYYNWLLCSIYNFVWRIERDYKIKWISRFQ